LFSLSGRFSFGPVYILGFFGAEVTEKEDFLGMPFSLFFMAGSGRIDLIL
jgi:hypothetical protein